MCHDHDVHHMHDQFKKIEIRTREMQKKFDYDIDHELVAAKFNTIELNLSSTRVQSNEK